MTPKARERFCCMCGDSMGVIEGRYYDRSDTCGKNACERESRNDICRERDEVHEQLDRDRGWS